MPGFSLSHTIRHGGLAASPARGKAENEGIPTLEFVAGGYNSPHESLRI